MSSWSREPFVHLVWLVLAYLMWSIVFVLLYGGHGGFCTRGANSLVQPVLGIATAGFLLLHVLLIWRARVWRRRSREDAMLPRLTVIVSASALPASCWLLIPLLFLVPCA